jgi:hypothetical protein
MVSALTGLSGVGLGNTEKVLGNLRNWGKLGQMPRKTETSSWRRIDHCVGSVVLVVVQKAG